MASQDIYLTREGIEKLRKELEQLKTVKRRQLTQAIAEARAHGDLSENAEYDAAREAQALNEKRVAELGDKLARARVLDDANIPSDKVYLGATVTLEDLDTREQEVYTVVSEPEADPSRGKISVASPIGKGLLGHPVGDRVEIRIPAGLLRYKILKIAR